MEMVNTFMTSDRMTRTGRIRTDVNAQPRNEEMAGFFPGVPDETLAAPVRVGAGEERLGVEVRLSVKATFTVSGRVVSPGPTGGFGMVSLRPDAPGATNLASFLGNTGIVDPQGNFTIRNVEPGNYTLEARSEGLGGRDFRASLSVEVANADGSYSLSGVAPGEYRLFARGRRPAARRS